MNMKDKPRSRSRRFPARQAKDAGRDKQAALPAARPRRKVAGRPSIRGRKRLPQLKFNEKGLIPVIVQDVYNGDVLMLAYMSRESLKITLREKRTCFYSRSRRMLWRKGETSGNIQKVKSIWYDCDKDTLLVKVKQYGAACHTGRRSCFYRKIYP